MNKPSCISRRVFLRRTSAASMTVLISGLPGVAGAMEIPAWVDPYERVRIAKLNDIKRHEPVYFEYPDSSSLCFLVQMDGGAGGGVGPNKDIIAFHTVCPHMGGPLHGTYKKDHAAAGPCPFHLTTFDLRKHGMVIAGHSTESLPQVVLEEEGEWLVATGMMGLIYGRASNTGE